MPIASACTVSVLQIDIRKYFPSWWKDATCYQIGLDVFFGSEEQPSSLKRARVYCIDCPVKRECLEHALVTPEEYGIWAGTSARGREAMRLAIEEGYINVTDLVDKVLSNSFRWRRDG